jgi:hypothetical protein
MRQIWHITQIGETENTYRVLVRKREGKRSLEEMHT